MRLITTRTVAITIVMLVCLGIGAMWAVRSAAADVDTILALCGSDTDKAACYEREIPRLYPKRSLPELFDTIRQIRVADPSYQFCHVLAHKLGQQAVAADPAAWIDLIPMNPFDGLCSNGFIHGVIIGRFRDAVLDDATLTKAMPDLKRACEPRANWQPASLDQSICYHGMGHLFDYITNADLPLSLSLCKKVGTSATGDFTNICEAGVFMQIYQPLEPEDFALIERLPVQPTRENYRRFCGSFDDPAAEGACLREAWPLFHDELMSGEGVRTFCADQPNMSEENACYVSVATIVARLQLETPEKVKSACEAFPASHRAECYVTAAQAVLEEDRTEAAQALAMCESASTAGIVQECIATLASRAGFIFAPDSAERSAFCAVVPAAYQPACLRER